MAKRNKLGIGLDIGSRTIQLSVLRSSKTGIVLDRVASKELPHDTIVEGTVMDSQVLSDSISELLREQKLLGKEAALSVSGRQIMIKRIDTDEMTDEELNSAIMYEARSALPFDISEVSLDYARMPQELDSGRMEVLLVAAKNEIIANATDPVRWAGGRPGLLEAEPFALQAALSEAGYLDSESPVASLQIGFQSSDLTLFHNGQYESNRNLHVGSKTYVEELIRELGITFERAAGILARTHRTEEEQHALERIAHGVAEKLADLVERAMPEYFGSTAERHVGTIVLCGGGAHLPMLQQALHDKFGIQVEVANPFKHFGINSHHVDAARIEQGPEYATSVGLALRALGEIHTGFDLLSPSHKKAQKAAAHPGSGLVIAALSFSAIFLGMVMMHITQENRLSALRSKLDDLKKDTDVYRDKIALVEDLTKKRADISARIDVISNLDKNRFARVKLVQLLNRTLPELTWLTNVQETTTPRGPGFNVSGITSSNLKVSQFMTSMLQDADVKGVDLLVSEQSVISEVDVTQFTLQVAFPPLGLISTGPQTPADELARNAKEFRDKRKAQSEMKKK
jgi:type IV pilus assembly protein PilM